MAAQAAPQAQAAPERKKSAKQLADEETIHLNSAVRESFRQKSKAASESATYTGEVQTVLKKGGLANRLLRASVDTPGPCCALWILFFATPIVIWVVAVSFFGGYVMSAESQYDWRQTVGCETCSLATEVESIETAMRDSDGLRPGQPKDPNEKYSRKDMTHNGLVQFIKLDKEDGADAVPKEDDEDVFTPKMVQHICEVEKVWISQKDYGKVCQQVWVPPCSVDDSQPSAALQVDASRCSTDPASANYNDPDVSLVQPPSADLKYRCSHGAFPLMLSNHFYGYYHSHECGLLSEASVTASRDALYAAIAAAPGSPLMFFMDKFFKGKGKSTTYTRTIIPFAGERSTLPDDVEKRLEFKAYMAEVDTKLQERYDASRWSDSVYDNKRESYSGWSLSRLWREFLGSPMSVSGLGPGGYKLSGIQVRYMNATMLDNEAMSTLDGDILLIFFIIFFVFAYIWGYTRSVFIAAFGVAQIVFILPLALLVHRYVLGIGFFNGFGVSSSPYVSILCNLSSNL